MSLSEKVLETDRLVLRRLGLEHAAFILELVNDPSWLRFIGDKGVRSLDDARGYLVAGPMAMYERHGFGLYFVELREGGVALGMCGLIKRDALDDVDIGFAFLPGFRGKGYAAEASAAVMAYGRSVIGLDRIVAITSPDNDNSIRLLEKLGLKFERMLLLAGDDTETKLFAHDYN
jgi:ribosomal-protein-alanine N-acetyltransferase